MSVFGRKNIVENIYKLCSQSDKEYYGMKYGTQLTDDNNSYKLCNYFILYQMYRTQWNRFY